MIERLKETTCTESDWEVNFLVTFFLKLMSDSRMLSISMRQFSLNIKSYRRDLFVNAFNINIRIWLKPLGKVHSP